MTATADPPPASPSPSDGDAAASSAPPVRIVIAEDSRIQAAMLIKRLKGAGYDVRAGADGSEAFDLIVADPPDLIISDIEMPVMNGYELCRRVKSHDALRNIPLILLSTLSEPEDIIEGLNAGADNYVTKPYETDHLLGRVKALLDTPLDAPSVDDDKLRVNLRGKTYEIESGRQQVLNLLISTFENAVEKNVELIHANQELSAKRDELTKLNADLEASNERMRRDLEAAARIQQSLLPAERDDLDRVDVAWRYLPCDELAGDFLNFFPLGPDVMAFYVVDVSGHGVASSLLSVTVARSLTRQLSSSSILVRPGEDGEPEIMPPAEVAAELNRRFPMEDQGNLYFTMCYGTLDLRDGTMRYVSAGHVPPVLVRDGESPRLLPAEGFAIGWMDDIDYDIEEITLQPGDRVLIFSDGVNEAMNEDLEEFGDDRMLQSIAGVADAPIDGAVADIRQTIEHWCRVNGPKDDVSILGIHYHGA